MDVGEKRDMFRSREFELQEWIKQCDARILRSLYYWLKEQEIIVKQSGSDSVTHLKFKNLFIYFGIPEYVKSTKKLCSLAFYETELTLLEDFKQKDKNVTSFLNLSFPHQADIFRMVFNMDNHPNIGFYLKQICRISPRVLKEISLHKFKINKQQFERLIVSFKHIEGLGLDSCKLSITAPSDFSESLKNAKICKINLAYCGWITNSDWRNKPNEFAHIIKGFSTSPDLKLSLKMINLFNCQISRLQVKSLKKEYGLEEIKFLL
ncbi:unnamed protein product [Moneuplotes crassus]|uniref:Uncharacterized protein n=1 Tax=Euplotes crassus TaxID=5936 RepID=A0AAD1UMY6_EUPCR|nr:unnamed protein product [Moneuplotes crassus]